MKGDYRDPVLPPGTKVLTTRLPAELGGPFEPEPAPAAAKKPRPEPRHTKPGRAKPNKYGAIPKVYNGVRYASTAEADRAKRLDEYQAVGIVRWWIGQPKFRLGCPENVYIADFLVVNRDLSVTVEDVKGVRTAKFAHDVKLWRAYGPCDLWIVKGGKMAEIIKPEPRREH